MFSDNKQLIGHHWLYEDLVDSMKDFNVSVAYEMTDPYMQTYEIRDLLDTRDFNSDEVQLNLYRLLNMNKKGVYMYDNEAKLVHQLLVYNNVFTKNQWDKLAQLVKVFEFNADYKAFMNEITINAESYIVKYAGTIVNELNRGILVVLNSQAEFEVMFDMFKTVRKNNFDDYCFKTIYFLGKCILEFKSRWNDSDLTVQRRLTKYIASVSKLDNPYWYWAIF